MKTEKYLNLRCAYDDRISTCRRCVRCTADKLLFTKGALERVIIDALNDIPQESALIQEVERFVGTLKMRLVPQLSQTNKANKATVGTFFSVRNPKNAMRSFGIFVHQIDWSKSVSLKQLFLPFQYLGEDKSICD